ncbi:MAG: hypothetical protein MJ187_02345 [Alphaproteobacteria bacterium]|nr:hypothetical protein [Alphaproteobacteria bacterium]
MKHITHLFTVMTLMLPTLSFAAVRFDAKQFRNEVSEGLDLIGARKNVIVVPDDAPGELGRDVYQKRGVVDTTNSKIYIPTSMYVRMGGGINLSFATESAKFGGKRYETSDSWTTMIGLGWDLSSYVRSELDLQSSTFHFSDLNDMQAKYHTASAMLYFDFARRYVLTGDVTQRRSFVPFFGIGAGIGQYKFDGTDGANGFTFVAPCATFGVNIMFTDLIGIDIMYQNQLMAGNGFGWNTARGGANNIGNLMATMRFNF